MTSVQIHCDNHNHPITKSDMCYSNLYCRDCPQPEDRLYNFDTEIFLSKYSLILEKIDIFKKEYTKIYNEVEGLKESQSVEYFANIDRRISKLIYRFTHSISASFTHNNTKNAQSMDSLIDREILLYKPVYETKRNSSSLTLDSFYEKYHNELYKINVRLPNHETLIFKKQNKFNIPYFINYHSFTNRDCFESYFPKATEHTNKIKEYIDDKYDDKITKAMAYLIMYTNRKNFKVNKYANLNADEQGFIQGYVDLVVQKSLLAFNFDPIKIINEIYFNFISKIENFSIPLRDFDELLRYRPTKELQQELNSKNLDYVIHEYKSYTIGTIEDKLLQGWGMKVSVKNDYVLIGQFKNNKLNGSGKLINLDPVSKKVKNYYIGEFLDNNLYGFGYQVILNNDGSNIKYSLGYFENGRRNGFNILEWSHGDCQEAIYRNFNRNGFGLYNWAENDFYIGSWKDGKKNSYGEYLHPNGDWYKGHFENDNYNGLGQKYESATKQFYIGQWKDYHSHGEGKYVFKTLDGKYMEVVGEFYHDKNYDSFRDSKRSFKSSGKKDNMRSLKKDDDEGSEGYDVKYTKDEVIISKKDGRHNPRTIHNHNGHSNSKSEYKRDLEDDELYPRENMEIKYRLNKKHHYELELCLCEFNKIIKDKLFMNEPTFIDIEMGVNQNEDDEIVYLDHIDVITTYESVYLAEE